MSDVPKGLKTRGVALWGSIMSDLEGEEYDRAMVMELCRTADVIDGLAAVIERDGLTTEGSSGQTVVHPAVPELRQQQQSFSRLLTQLNLENVETGILSPRQASAKAAAQQRWREEKARRRA